VNGSLAAGASASYSVAVTIPNGVSGSKKIMVGCDGTSVITESTETNNQYFTGIMVESTIISQIQWSGYTWIVRNGSGNPGPNNWSASPSTLWVDNNGNLHMRIVNINGKWYSSEIYLQQSLGYGAYTFEVSTNVEMNDKNVVLGLFTYENDTREIDLEFSRWGNASTPAGWYVVQPSTVTSRNNFALNLSGSYSTHKFNWYPNEIVFQSFHGHNTADLINKWVYSGLQIPPPGNERVHINFWLYNGYAPSGNSEAEVILKSFSFKKVANGDLIVQVLNQNDKSVPVPGSNGIVRLYDSNNVLKQEQTTNELGYAEFSDFIPGKDYYYTVFNNPKTSVEIKDNQLSMDVFKRNLPYCEKIFVYQGSRDMTQRSIEPNNELKIIQEIINPSEMIQQVRGKVILSNNSQTVYTLTNDNFVPIPANGKVKLEWTIRPEMEGFYFATSGVEVLNENNPVVCDGPSYLAESFLKEPLFKINRPSDGITKYYALLIGNGDGNSFKLGDGFVTDESLTRTDIEYVSKTLIEEGIYWTSERIITLFNEQVSYDAVHGSIKEISEKMDGDDIFLFYYVGHGSPYGLYLFSHEMLSPGNLSAHLNRYVPESAKVMLALGACYSGIFTDYFHANPRSNCAVLAAAKSDEAAPAQALNINMITKSPFSYLFCQSIKGIADSNKDNTITLQETFNYLSPELTRVSLERSHPQFEYTDNTNLLPLSFRTLYAVKVNTKYVTDLTSGTASSGGIITISGDGLKSTLNSTAPVIISKGICWGTSVNPTVELYTKTVESTDSQEFKSVLSGLESGKTYHLRAYATTSEGIYYGEDIEFNTFITGTIPVISTNRIYSVGYSNAACEGNILFDGGFRISANGFCWSTQSNINFYGNNNGSFIATIDGLLQGTTYHIRAYAINGKGISYGEDLEFNTLSSVEAPQVFTKQISAITENSATSGGTVQSDGGASIIEKGICWSTTPNPTIDLITKTMYGEGLNDFISTLFGLKGNTVYHVRAYATNSVGTRYGEDIIFTTKNDITSVKVNPAGLANIFYKIYPNPTNGIVTIEGLPQNKQSEIAVYTVNGVQILRKETTGWFENIDLSNQVAGLYLLVVNDQHFKIAKK
jgi:hypothetical protein